MIDEKALAEREFELHGKMKAHLERRDADWTAEAETEWQAMEKEADEIKETLATAKAGRQHRERLDQVQADMEGRFGGGRRGFGNDLPPGGGRGDELRFVNEMTGAEVRAVQHNERFATRQQPDSLARIIASRILGEPDIMPRQVRDQISAGDSEGGYLTLPTEIGASVIDLARSASVTREAGALWVPLHSGESVLTCVTQDPTVHWAGELQGVPSSFARFGRITLHPKKLAVHIPLSIELIEDSQNIVSAIQTAISGAMGKAVDSAGLIGTGSENEPLGIANHAGANSVASVGTPTTYAGVTTAVKKILESNYNGALSGLSWINNPSVGALYDGLADTTNQPLRPTPWVEKLQNFSTTAMPSDGGSGEDESTGIVGDFSQLIYGFRALGTRVRVHETGYVSDGNGSTVNALSDFAKIVSVYLRVDTAIVRPSWFSVLSGITLS